MSEFPPLTSVREVEVHGWQLAEDHEWACRAFTHGEMSAVQYDWRCPACTEAAEERIRELGDVTMWWVQKPGMPSQVVTLSWLITRARTIEAETAEAFGFPEL